MISVIGDLVVDILVTKGATNYATDTDGNIQFRPGGQANNVAQFIVREGARSRLIGKVGNDPFGTYLVQESTKRGVTCMVATDDHVQTGKIVILIDKDSGERSMIPDRGANLYLEESDIKDIENSELLYLSGYSLFADKPYKAVQLSKKKALAEGIPIALDPSSTFFLKEHRDELLQFLEGITFFFPNYEEGVFLTGEEDPQKIVAELKKYVPVPVLTLGDKGCLLFYENEYIEIPAPNVRVVDTTAAGDSFVGSFLAVYSRTRDVVRAAERAVEVSAQTVTYFGALPD